MVDAAAPAIRIRGVNKSFRTTHAVRDLDLDVPSGSLCGFLGPNGAGKSTTIRMIMSIIYPDTGTVEVLGGSALDHKDLIGYLPEERGLYRKMRVAEFLAYIAKLKGAAKAGLDARVLDWLARVDLADVARKRCQELSKGMQQKVQFLAAIIHEPQLIILDEPFSGLDPVNAAIIRELVHELHGEGRTIIFSTHVLHQAEQICDRILLINKGVKLLDATLEEIRERFDPRTLEVRPTDDRADLSRIPGVEHQARGNDETVALRLKEDADPAAVIRAIVETCDVRSVNLRQVSLDEVFVQHVRRDAGEEAAQQAELELSHVG